MLILPNVLAAALTREPPILRHHPEPVIMHFTQILPKIGIGQKIEEVHLVDRVKSILFSLRSGNNLSETFSIMHNLSDIYGHLQIGEKMA